MKKIALFVISTLCLYLCGCTINSLNVSAVVSDYFSVISVNNSEIVSCDEQKIKQLSPEFVPFDVFSLSENIYYDGLCRYYTFHTKGENSHCDENDLVKLSIKSLDSSEEVESKTLYIIISNQGKSIPELQKSLIGKKHNYSGVIAQVDNNISATPFQYTVSEIWECQAISEEMTQMLINDGYSSPIMLFDSLFSVKLKDEQRQTAYKARQNYLLSCINQCKYKISSDDIENLATHYIQVLNKNAKEWGMDVESFWKEFSGQIIGNPVNTDPFLYAVETAEVDIKIALWVGHMACCLGITAPVEKVIDYYEMNGVQKGQNEIYFYAYNYLEDMVIASLVPELTDSRLLPPTYTYQDYQGDSAIASGEDINDSALEKARQEILQIEKQEADARRFIEYWECNTETMLYYHFVGVDAMDSEGLKIRLLCDGNDTCLSEIEKFDFTGEYYTDYSKEYYPGMPCVPYYLQKQHAEIIQQQIDHIRSHANTKEGTALEREFLTYDPRLQFGTDGLIAISMHAKSTFSPDDGTAKDEERGVFLFEELIGKYEGVFFGFLQ